MPPEKNVPLDTFISHLERFDREGATACALSLLEGGMSVAELYENVLAPSLNRIQVPRAQEDSRIWREHMMSYIVRGVMESAYPHVLKERDRSGMAGKDKKVMLACPEEEYHEIGVRMGADFFTILGWEVAYVGANTPRDTLLDAARALKPDTVALSVTNYLNLAQLPALIKALKAQAPGLQVLLGGSALRHTGKSAADFGADGSVNSFASIKALGEVKK